MTVTKAQADSARAFHYAPRCELRHEAEEAGAKVKDIPTIERWRANGACKMWKRTPERFRLPVKWGLRGYHEITETNADQFHTEEDCPYGY